MEQKEIYLQDYVKVLWKRKWVVILVPVISVFTTAVFIFGFNNAKLKPKLFRGVVTIQNGFIQGQSPIFEKQESLEIIRQSNGGRFKEISFKDILIPLYGPYCFEVEIKGEDTGLIKKLVQDYIDSGNNFYNKRIKISKDKVDILNKQKQIAEDVVNEIQNVLSELNKNKELTDAQIFEKKVDYKIKINNFKNQIIEIESKIFDIDLALSNSKKFMIMSPLTITELAVSKFDKKSKIMLSAVFGLLGGIILAFVIENWSLPKGEAK